MSITVPARSHTCTVPSLQPLTAVRPSAVTATAVTATPVTGRVWPVRVCLLERLARPREGGPDRAQPGY
jgi:hypothetical protein